MFQSTVCLERNNRMEGRFIYKKQNSVIKSSVFCIDCFFTPLLFTLPVRADFDLTIFDALFWLPEVLRKT